jgi:hypothetical protein
MSSKSALRLWLPEYVRGAAARAHARSARRWRLTHVVFLVCDHYEPRHGATRDEQPAERVATWQREYPRFQQRCRDAFGHAPLHTWFYPPHHGAEHLPALAEMAFAGGGEVELHYHHDNDTAQTLRRDLLATLDLYNSHGLLLANGNPPRRNFGFVHGDWTLDNACNGPMCGVNGELSILKELGCWADFTMPSANEAQTRKINSIYYAVDDPSRHKSHNTGRDATVGGTHAEGFLLIQGPLGINWKAPGYPRIENASLTSANWGRPDRIERWIDCNVHVDGRPEWLFVKLHTHGAIERDFDALFGEKAFAMHRTLNERFNDGRRYRLHYATARQAYNLVKAAEAGKSGDPSRWFDFAVAPPVTSVYALGARHRVHACTPTQLRLAGVASDAPVRLSTRIGAVREVAGRLASVHLDADRGIADIDCSDPSAELVLRTTADVDLVAQGPAITSCQRSGDGMQWTVRTDAGRARMRVVPGRQPVAA